MRTVLNAILVVCVASSATEIRRLQAEQVEMVLAARNICHVSRQTLSCFGTDCDEATKSEALNFRREIDQLITDLQSLLDPAKTVEWNLNIGGFAFSTRLLIERIAGISDVISRASAASPFFNTGLSDSRKSVTELEARMASFRSRLKIALVRIIRENVPAAYKESIRAHLANCIEMVRRTIRSCADVRKMTVMLGAEPSMRAADEAAERLMGLLFALKGKLVRSVSELEPIFAGNVEAGISRVLATSAAQAEAMTKSVQTFREVLQDERFEALRGNLEAIGTDWDKISKMCSELRENFVRIISGIRFPEERTPSPTPAPVQHLLLPPTVVSLTLQMASQVEAMKAIADQVHANAFQAASCPPTLEACQVFASFVYETSGLVQYIEQFRVRMQGMLAYANAQPRLAVTSHMGSFHA
jgi:hypothetical protein